MRRNVENKVGNLNGIRQYIRRIMFVFYILLCGKGGKLNVRAYS